MSCHVIVETQKDEATNLSSSSSSNTQKQEEKGQDPTTIYPEITRSNSSRYWRDRANSIHEQNSDKDSDKEESKNHLNLSNIIIRERSASDTKWIKGRDRSSSTDQGNKKYISPKVKESDPNLDSVTHETSSPSMMVKVNLTKKISIKSPSSKESSPRTSSVKKGDDDTGDPEIEDGYRKGHSTPIVSSVRGGITYMKDKLRKNSQTEETVDLSPSSSPRRRNSATKKTPNVKVLFDEKGFPIPRPKEFRIFASGGGVATLPWRAEDVIIDVIKKVCLMWPSWCLTLEKEVTDINGNIIDRNKTVGELQIHIILFGVNYETWKKQYELYTKTDLNTSLLVPKSYSAQSSHSPRIQVLRVCLPQGQRSNVFWDGDKTLRQIIEELCSKRDISTEGKIACDLQGNVLDMDQKLENLKISEITFGISVGEWNNQNIDAEAGNFLDSGGDDILIVSPRTSSPRSLDNSQDILIVSLPNEGSSKVFWSPEKTLADSLGKVLLTRGLKLDDIFAKDEDGRKLDLNKTLSELGVWHVTLCLKSEELLKPFNVYLPGGQLRKMKYDPEKPLNHIIDLLMEANPELQTKGFKPCDLISGSVLDSNTLQSEIDSQGILFGTTKKEWNDYQCSDLKKNKSLNKTTSKMMIAPTATLRKSKRNSMRSNRPKQKTTRLSNDANPDEIKKKLESKFFRVYLPGGDCTVVTYEPEKELSKVLEKVLSARPNIIGQPKDIEGNTLDPTKKLSELGVNEIAFGIDMEKWTLLKSQEKIKEYLREEDGPSSDKIFKIYLPNGHISSVFYNPNKTLKEVLDKLCENREDLRLDAFSPKNLQGVDLDLDLTLNDLNTKEICFGTDILDWVMFKQHELVDKIPKVKQRLSFVLDNQDKTSPSDTARGYKKKERGYERPKSPKKKGKEIKKALKGVDYTKILVDSLNQRGGRYEDDMASDISALNTSYWHIQHSHMEDEKLLEHYFEEEANYKTNFLVPFRFLEHNHKLKNYNEIELKRLEEITFESEDQSSDDYEKWMRSMDSKVLGKRKEFQEVSVTFVGTPN